MMMHPFDDFNKRLFSLGPESALDTAVLVRFIDDNSQVVVFDRYDDVRALAPLPPGVDVLRLWVDNSRLGMVTNGPMRLETMKEFFSHIKHGDSAISFREFPLTGEQTDTLYLYNDHAKHEKPVHLSAVRVDDIPGYSLLFDRQRHQYEVRAYQSGQLIVRR